MTFCNDVDLLHWEPNICRDAAFASQLMIGGTGDLAGTTFTISSGSLLASHVTPNQVLVLSGAIAGCYPIVTVMNATQLALSTLYDGLYPAAGPALPNPVGTGAALTYAIRTFWPQRRIVSEMLLQAARLDPTAVAERPEMIVNSLSLKKPCVLGTLQMIYAALAAAGGPMDHQTRADLYERLYRRALRETRLEIDFNNDGDSDAVRTLDIIAFQRA